MSKRLLDFMLHPFRVTFNYKIYDWCVVLYFKHNELVEKYNVSLKTVHNWIDSARQGKLGLELFDKNGRTYVANTTSNIATLERLVEKGKKYRNTLHHKTVSPQPAFYKLYSQRQILDIISSLSIHREIPRQYNYLDGGAANWDNWLKSLEYEESSNILKGTLELIAANIGSLDLLVQGRKRINVIDIGVGNARPVKELLQHLLERGMLNRYVAIDISDAMLQIAKANITSWFGDRVKFEGYVRDITFERFDDLLVSDMLGKEAEQTVNLVLLLGGTQSNFRSPADIMKVIYGSMSAKDLLLYTDKPDSEASRRYFYFNPKKGSNDLSPNHRFIIELLNIDKSLYTTEMAFDEQKRMRYIRIKLTTALTIKFEFEGGKRCVELEKGDTILLLRIWHQTALEIISEFEKTGFTLLQSSLTKDRQFLLTISGVDAKSSA